MDSIVDTFPDKEVIAQKLALLADQTGNAGLADADVKAAVDYMAGAAK